MNILTYDSLVWIAKSVGLIYLVVLSVLVVAYVYWPTRKAEFDRAAHSILDGEELP